MSSEVHSEQLRSSQRTTAEFSGLKFTWSYAGLHGAQRPKVAVIDSPQFRQDCLINALNACCPDLIMVPLSTVTKCFHSGRLGLTKYCTPRVARHHSKEWSWRQSRSMRNTPNPGRIFLWPQKKALALIAALEVAIVDFAAAHNGRGLLPPSAPAISPKKPARLQRAATFPPMKVFTGDYAHDKCGMKSQHCGMHTVFAESDVPSHSHLEHLS